MVYLRYSQLSGKSRKLVLDFYIGPFADDEAKRFQARIEKTRSGLKTDELVQMDIVDRLPVNRAAIGPEFFHGFSIRSLNPEPKFVLL